MIHKYTTPAPFILALGAAATLPLPPGLEKSHKPDLSWTSFRNVCTSISCRLYAPSREDLSHFCAQMFFRIVSRGISFPDCECGSENKTLTNDVVVSRHVKEEFCFSEGDRGRQKRVRGGKIDGRSKRQQFYMFDQLFDRLLFQILATSSLNPSKIH